jgi:hypothetical protein
MEKILANKNPGVNDIRSIGVKETLVTETLGTNPTSIVGANPTIAMEVDITKVDITSNSKQHRGGMLLKVVVPMDGRMQAKLQRYYHWLVNSQDWNHNNNDKQFKHLVVPMW